MVEIVERLRKWFPILRIILRGDSGFYRDNLMNLCDGLGLQYGFGIEGNKVLNRIVRGSLRAAKSMLEFSHSQSELFFQDFQGSASKLRTAEEWRASVKPNGPTKAPLRGL